MSVIMNVLNTVKREQAAGGQAIEDRPEVEEIKLEGGLPEKETITPEKVQEKIKKKIDRPTSPRQTVKDVPIQPIAEISQQSQSIPKFVSSKKTKTSNQLRSKLTIFIIASLIFITLGLVGWFVTGWLLGGNTVQEEKIVEYLPAAGVLESETKTIMVRHLNERLLQGIILDDSEPYCVIDGKILKINDEWKGKTITTISEEGVLLADSRGNQFFIKNKINKQ